MKEALHDLAFRTKRRLGMGLPTLHRGTTATGLVPLVVVACHSSVAGTITQTRFPTYADQYGIACVIVDFSTPPSAATYISYLKANLPSWCSQLQADPNKVYLAGFSAGATKAQSVATEGSVKIAGIAPASGWRYLTDPTRRTGKFRFFATCGDSGDVTPVEGNATFEGLTTTAKLYDRLNGGTSNPSFPTSGTVRTKAFSPYVKISVVHGGGHCWPSPWGTITGGFHAADRALNFSDEICKWVKLA